MTADIPAFARRRLADAGTSHDRRGFTVVVLNDFCYVQGGASKVAIDEAVSLAQAGAQVIFIGAVGPPCDALQRAPLTVVNLGQRELLDAAKHPGVALQGLWNVRAARQVAEILRGLDPARTVVHLHGYTKALTVSPVKAARRRGFAVVCTLHDFFGACPNGALFDYRAGKPCTRKALSPACMMASCDKRHYAHKVFRVVRGAIQKHFGGFPANVDHYISLSRRSAGLLRPYLPKSALVHPLENAIDWARPSPAAAAGNRALVYVGRLDEEKGVDMLAATATALGLGVTFVGDGPLRRRIEGRPGMKVTGWIARDDVRRHLEHARCLVFPSLWYETYGLVVAEAAAHGIPAIVSDVTAAAERVEDGATGWVFRSGDAADLARCLQETRDDTCVRRFGEAAYARFWANAPTSAAHAADLLSIYESVLAPRTADQKFLNRGQQN